MNWLFYIAAFAATISTYLAISRYNPMHALLYLIVSFLATAVVFFTLGASFVALLQIILYAGAIIVLFLFVVMMLNLGEETAKQEKNWLHPNVWIGPSLLAAILLVQLFYMIWSAKTQPVTITPIPVKTISKNLFQSYVLAVELASMQKIFFGKKENPVHLSDFKWKETLVMTLLVLPLIFLGVHPKPVMKSAEPVLNEWEQKGVIHEQKSSTGNAIPNESDQSSNYKLNNN